MKGISSVTREKRARRVFSPSSILWCLQVHRSLSSETVPMGFCLICRYIVQILIYWSKTGPHSSQQIVTPLNAGTCLPSMPGHGSCCGCLCRFCPVLPKSTPLPWACSLVTADVIPDIVLCTCQFPSMQPLYVLYTNFL